MGQVYDWDRKHNIAGKMKAPKYINFHVFVFNLKNDFAPELGVKSLILRVRAHEIQSHIPPEVCMYKAKSHPGKGDAAVAAAGALGRLLVVVRHEHAPGRLDHLGLVGLGVVGMAPSVGYAPVPANHLQR